MLEVNISFFQGKTFDCPAHRANATILQFFLEALVQSGQIVGQGAEGIGQSDVVQVIDLGGLDGR